MTTEIQPGLATSDRSACILCMVDLPMPVHLPILGSGSRLRLASLATFLGWRSYSPQMAWVSLAGFHNPLDRTEGSSESKLLIRFPNEPSVRPMASARFLMVLVIRPANCPLSFKLRR